MDTEWEAREDRLLRQIAALEAENRHSGTSENAPQNQGTQAPREQMPQRNENLLGELSTVSEHDTGISVGVDIEPHPQLEGPIFSPSLYIPHHLPPFAPYKAEMTPDAETIEWLERFSMLAEECRWTPRAKLLHLTSRLEKEAYTFYRSCIPQIKESYDRLATELRKHFTPIRIQGVDTSLFHEQKQRPGESVDQYAQELRRLHQKAYPESLRGSEEAKQIGKTLLASQFLKGLHLEIKKNVTVSEQSGEIDKLLAKARFEEAKLLELSSNEPRSTPTGDTKQGKTFVPHPPKLNHPQGPWLQRPPPLVPRSPMICYHCGGKGHPARYCRWRNSKENESKGKHVKSTGANRMSAIHTDQGSDYSGKEPSEYIAELRQELQRVEVEEALSKSKARRHGTTSTTTDKETPLGPVIKTEVESHITDAMLDTGSPTTIVSLEFLLDALWKRKPIEQSREEWEDDVRIKVAEVTLQNYGGNIVGKTVITIIRGSYSHVATVQVQRHGPVPLLIGTDLQPELGFLFCKSTLKRKQ